MPVVACLALPCTCPSRDLAAPPLTWLVEFAEQFMRWHGNSLPKMVRSGDNIQVLKLDGLDELVMWSVVMLPSIYNLQH